MLVNTDGYLIEQQVLIQPCKTHVLFYWHGLAKVHLKKINLSILLDMTKDIICLLCLLENNSIIFM
jgi:hypothetical protein